MAQRFQVFEAAALEGNWERAQRLDISNAGRSGLTIIEERLAAKRMQLLEAKLEESTSEPASRAAGDRRLL